MMSRTQVVCLVLFFSFALIACAEQKSMPTDADSKKSMPTDEDSKMFYFLGTGLSRNIAPLGLTDAELDYVVQGLRDAMSGDALELDQAVYNERLNKLAEERSSALSAEEGTLASAYVEKMAGEEGARTTESGIVILEMAAGDGEQPAADSVVKAHYHGTLRDGTVFDSSVDRGEPFEASLGRVIPCWTEAIQTIKVGGKSKITCPSDLAYGSNGRPPTIPGGAALTFEVELLEIVK